MFSMKGRENRFSLRMYICEDGTKMCVRDCLLPPPRVGLLPHRTMGWLPHFSFSLWGIREEIAIKGGNYI